MTTITLEREKEARKYIEVARDNYTRIKGLEYNLERAYIAGCENEASRPRWRNPRTSMPKDGERAIVAVFSVGRPIAVRIMLASRKEITDVTSPVVFKSLISGECVIGWLPLPEFDLSNVKDYE